jgi:hypothetical protein
MKKIAILTLFFFSFVGKAQIEKVIVETYYVSDTLDVTDTIDGATRALPVGSKTYRVYIDLKRGYKLAKIFGDANHALKIKSTANFFNNIDRPSEYYGYLIKKNYFTGNPTLALDSWLTLGLATTVNNGILKTQDTNGTIRTNNWKGTAGISGGILRNNDPAIGIPLTSKDGLLPNVTTYTNGFNDHGFTNGLGSASGRDTTVFGDTIVGSQFISHDAYLYQSSGVMGAFADSNQVLVAQLTTTGTLSFELNVLILDSNGNNPTYYVAKGSSADNYAINPFLSYPPPCGCRDDRYLEFNPNAACDAVNACQTLKVFGCTDSMACNYNPNANVFLPDFCCYPGYCNDRNIALVCPDLSPYKLKQKNISEDVYPNPVQNNLTLQLIYSADFAAVTYTIYDTYGRVIKEQDLGTIHGNSLLQTDVSDLPNGLYLFRVSVAGNSSIKKFIKN